MHSRLGLRTVLSCFLGFSCLLSVASAQAQATYPVDDPWFGAKLMLGVGGQAEFESDAGGGSVESDLELTYGAGLQYMYPLHDYFGLGGQVALRSWQTEAGEEADADRSLLLDIALVPAARFVVQPEVELYLAVPIGLALDFWGPDEFSAGGTAAAASVDVGTGIGLDLAFMFGARFSLSDGVGLLGELGYELHSFTHEVTGSASIGPVGGSASTDVDVSLGQFVINLGVFFH